jgi:hypothetical protein
MEKVETSLGGKNDGQYNPKEEVFRCILTLHSLLENPPGDFPDNFREDIIKGFVGIFSYIRLVMNSPYSLPSSPWEKKTPEIEMKCLVVYMLFFIAFTFQG